MIYITQLPGLFSMSCLLKVNKNIRILSIALHQSFYQVDASFIGCFGAFHDILQSCANQGDQVLAKDWLATVAALSFAIAIDRLLLLAGRHLLSPVSLLFR